MEAEHEVATQPINDKLMRFNQYFEVDKLTASVVIRVETLAFIYQRQRHDGEEFGEENVVLRCVPLAEDELNLFGCK